MVDENPEYSILEYLKKNGATNTFKLAHVLEIKRDKLLKILKTLEEQGLVKITTGKAEFLSYSPSREKKKQKPKVSKEKSEVQTLQEEVKKQKLYAEKLKAQIKKLEQRPQKVITRTIIKDVKPKKIKEVKTKPKKIKRGIKLRKKLKKVLRIKKSFRKIGLRIKEGVGIFKIK
ncbi:MAG: hypothetical protein Q8N63_06410, partial [Nanoarchaeota archaeon]|nr:hypothetical protein [Nanoarchaeota archaeon]